MDDIKEQVKKYYESHRISFKELAKESQRLFGQSVAFDTIKTWSAREDGGWTKPPIQHEEKLKVISELLFNRIEEEADTLDTKDLVQLANTFINLASKAPPPLEGDNKPTLQHIIDIANSE